MLSSENMEMLGLSLLCVFSILVCGSAAQRYRVLSRRAARRREIQQAARARAEEQHALHPPGDPLPAEVVSALPLTVFRSASPVVEDATCSICLTEYEDGEQLLTLPCKHCFHQECLGAWFHLHCTCPICRLSLLPGDEGEEREGNTRQPDHPVTVDSPEEPPGAQPHHPVAMDSPDSRLGAQPHHPVTIHSSDETPGAQTHNPVITDSTREGPKAQPHHPVTIDPAGDTPGASISPHYPVSIFSGSDGPAQSHSGGHVSSPAIAPAQPQMAGFETSQKHSADRVSNPANAPVQPQMASESDAGSAVDAASRQDGSRAVLEDVIGITAVKCAKGTPAGSSHVGQQEDMVGVSGSGLVVTKRCKESDEREDAVRERE